MVVFTSKMYKFSLSWSKILPNGFVNHVNQGQLNYYDRMIDEILANDMKPMVTLYHGELPDRIRQLGGWTNPLIIDWFVDYAQLVFMSFAYKVKFWVTVHEPTILCTLVLENSIPNQSGIADYLCGHHTLLAHAKAYHLYHEKFGHERGKIGITHLYTWLEADNPESSVDIEAVERAYQWYNNWLTHPVFSENGDYPHLMKRIVSEKSLLAFYRSRLPSFTQSEIDQVKGSADFVGINFYSASKVRGINPDPNDISFENDAAFQQTDSWPKESWTKSTPWALKKFLHRFNNEYLLPEIYVTQNGFIDNGDILDLGRCVYFREYILEILKAMKGGVDIRGYLAWSLVDEYEWKLNNNGSSGLFHVDLKDLMLLRTNKLSTKVLAYIYKNRVVDHMTKMLGNSWLELIYS
ncbi:myrosinase 1 isoform X2 [Prorops nasuta]|uniref:myrosinase 1 isoform X2 n=1 Tax=Prorops nasuta TaxID=863751 RepID=UPI0034CD456B